MVVDVRGGGTTCPDAAGHDPIGVAIFALIAALAKQDSDIEAELLRGAKDEIRAVGGRRADSRHVVFESGRTALDPNRTDRRL
ncbi:hypothetical protein [Streptomyces aureus]|uniref:hypothetical protein n=1 Tax=Streptomyces aureus TaxID=193461 RepID=UPI0006E389E4|nr:hypothetical protein [Streptomyces aureus]